MVAPLFPDLATYSPLCSPCYSPAYFHCTLSYFYNHSAAALYSNIYHLHCTSPQELFRDISLDFEVDPAATEATGERPRWAGALGAHTATTPLQGMLDRYFAAEERDLACDSCHQPHSTAKVR